MYRTFPRKARLPHISQRRPLAQQLLKEALCTALATRKPPAAAMRAAAPPGGSVYCASQPRASGDHARSSSRKLCILRLPHDSQPGGSGDHVRSSSSARKLCVLRLPHDSQLRASVDHARSSSSRKLCLLIFSSIFVFFWGGRQREIQQKGRGANENNKYLLRLSSLNFAAT